MEQTTITVSVEVKRRLAQAKGDRSWDDFLSEVADERLDEAIVLAERRLEELRAQKARGLALDDVDVLRAEKKADGPKRPGRKRSVDRAGASGGGRRARGP
jgi:predicted CopG family antitoxin